MDEGFHNALRRKMRLKELLDTGQVIDNNIDTQDSLESISHIRRIITESDAIMAEGDVEERAENTTEVVMDAQVVKMSHELITRVIKKTSAFDMQNYHDAIRKIAFQGGEYNWTKLTKMVYEICHMAKATPTMLGTWDADIDSSLVVKERKKTVRKAVGKATRPETLQKLDRKDKGAKKVNIFHKQFLKIYNQNDKKPIPFFKMIVNPDNFMLTVDNGFMSAFLSRDSVVAIEQGPDHFPYIRPVTAKEKANVKESDYRQAILTLDMDLCEKLKKYYNIKGAMIHVDDVEEEEPSKKGKKRKEDKSDAEELGSDGSDDDASGKEQNESSNKDADEPMDTTGGDDSVTESQDEPMTQTIDLIDEDEEDDDVPTTSQAARRKLRRRR